MYWQLDDDALLDQCNRQHYRASGPGGQHRNRTDSAVRLIHEPTGVVVTATERRSQHENLAVALTRLRQAIAFEWDRQQPWQPEDQATLQSFVRDGKLLIPKERTLFLTLAHLLLVMLTESNGQVSTVAERVGVTTGNIIKVFEQNDQLWQRVQQIRQQFGLATLKR